MALRNLIIIFRTLGRNRLPFAINVFSLGLSMTMLILIYWYVAGQFSYDINHGSGGSVFRLTDQMNFQGEFKGTAILPADFAEPILSGVKGVVACTRIASVNGRVDFIDQSRVYSSAGLYQVDSSFFSVFGFPLIAGDPKSCLDSNDKIVLTPELAQNIFGTRSALGRQVTIELGGARREMIVSGIVDSDKFSSHLNFQALISFRPGFEKEIPTGVWLYQYYKLQSGGDPQVAATSISTMLKGNFVSKYKDWIKYEVILQPVEDIHLKSQLQFELSPNSDISYIYIVVGIGLLSFLVAVMNYVNLNTAQAFTRTKEMAVKKITGAARSQLAIGLITESGVVVMLSFCIALIIAFVVSPQINARLSFPVVPTLDPNFWGMSLSFILVASILAGAYPAYYLVSLNLITALKSNVYKAATGSRMKLSARWVLVGTQLMIATGMIFAALTISDQISFLQSQDPGFDKQRIMVISVEDRRLNGKEDALKEAMMAIPGVVSASFSSSFPGQKDALPTIGYSFDDDSITHTDENLINSFMTDRDFVATMGLEVIQGRNFNYSPADASNVIINEALARTLGCTDCIGKSVTVPSWNFNGQIIGVVKDFNARSFAEPIKPVVIIPRKVFYSCLLLRSETGNWQELTPQLQQAWKSIESAAFEYDFLENHLNRNYQNETEVLSALKFIALLCMVFSAVGLMGLVTFVMQRKLKEIAVRKALGATSGSVFSLFIKDYLLICVVAMILVFYPVNLLVEAWLSTYHYRVTIGYSNYLLTGILTVGLTLVGVSATIAKAVRVSPGKILKYE